MNPCRDGGTCSPESVRAQLARILDSSAFSSAPKVSQFLEYLVDQALAGDADRLKEYSVALAVFDRPPSFDPRTDTIVRVQARRLRAKLEQYYARDGQRDPVFIEVPKGRYTARFRMTDHISPNALPSPCTSLIGRESELADLKALLVAEHVRLVTLTGAGGSGKTRLALEVASGLASAFPGGVHFIGLAFVTNADGVVSTLCQALGVRETGGTPLEDFLAAGARHLVRQRTMVLLDNFEHLVPAAPVLVRLLEACRALTIFVTSRAVLRVSGEHEYLLAPLRLPASTCASLDELLRNPAVALFTERARAANPAFGLSVANARATVDVCCRLDGLPLALELAAARIKLLSPAALLARLEKRLNLLTLGGRDRPARQQTLRDTLEWSHRLLSDGEQRLFRRLSVFAGGWTLEGAEAVCNTFRDLPFDVLEGMTSLIDKNLIRRVDTGEGETRFTMLETIREFGIERIAASGEHDRSRRAHAAYCLVLAEEGAAYMSARDRERWFAQCETERDNFRAALDYLAATDHGEWALRLSAALYLFFEERERLAEGRAWLEAALNLPSAAGPSKPRADAARCAGTLATDQGDFRAAIPRHQEALDIYQQLGDRRGVVAQLNSLGVSEKLQKHYEAARIWFERSLRACREAGDHAAIAAALSQLANTARAEGDYARAAEMLNEALAIFKEIGNRLGMALSLNQLGDVACDRGHRADAQRLYQEAAELFWELSDPWGLARSYLDLGSLSSDQGEHGDARTYLARALTIFGALDHRRGTANVLDGFACLAARQQDPARTLVLAGAAAAIRSSTGSVAHAESQARLDRILDAARLQCGQEAAVAAWSEGERMSLEQASRYALSESVSTGN